MGNHGLASLPSEVTEEILRKLDLESLCSVAPACRSLRSAVSQTLSKFDSINLCDIGVGKEVLSYLLCGNRSVQRLTVNCSRLDDSSIDIFNSILLSLKELVLQKCSNFSSKIFVALAQHCSNLSILHSKSNWSMEDVLFTEDVSPPPRFFLFVCSCTLLFMKVDCKQRSLSLELIYQGEIETYEGYESNLRRMFEGCPYLESLSITFKGSEFDPHIFGATVIFIPTAVKALHLCHVTEDCAKQLARECGVRRIAETSASSGIPSSVGVTCQTLQSLSLVVDHITDELLTAITQNLHLLVKLDLRDAPSEEQLLRRDLSNRGLLSLGSCNHLSHLSLVRSRVNSTFFRRVNDMGIFLMAEACRNMESIKLGGFIRVTDAGFSALIHNCKTLKTFELYSTFHLSDLTFLGLLDTSLSLVSVRLTSCNLITSESVNHLAFCENLELLDLNGCKSVADNGMRAISRLGKLNTLYLNGADITDTGLNFLGEGKTPLVSLSLRGCKRVTDKGIKFLLGDSIKKTLEAIDLGYIPGVSDKAIQTLTEFGLEIVDLCIRNCYSITDISIVALANTIHDGLDRKALKRLDLYNCIGLSAVSLHWFSKPYFPHLRWLGLGPAYLFTVHGSRKLGDITGRTNLTVCGQGCEMGCRDSWQFHTSL